MEEYKKPGEPKTESTIPSVIKKIGASLLVPCALYLATFGGYKIAFDESKTFFSYTQVKRLVLPFDKITYDKEKTFGSAEQMWVERPLRKPNLIKLVDVDGDNKVDMFYTKEGPEICKQDKEDLNKLWNGYKKRANIDNVVRDVEKKEEERYNRLREEIKNYKPDQHKTYKNDKTSSDDWFWWMFFLSAA